MNGSTSEKTIDTWALVELFGHQRIVGKVTEQAIGSASFIRVDVPTADGQGVLCTRFYGAAAIYCLSPIEKETAVLLARNIDAQPVKQYELPPIPQDTDTEPDTAF